MFGQDVPTQSKNQLKHILDIDNEWGMGSYLWILESFVGYKSKIFKYINERLHDQVNGLSAKFLSKGRKDDLIKSVALALPAYIMPCFKLSQSLISKLTSVIAKFWWSSNECVIAASLDRMEKSM